MSGVSTLISGIGGGAVMVNGKEAFSGLGSEVPTTFGFAIKENKAEVKLEKISTGPDKRVPS